MCQTSVKDNEMIMKTHRTQRFYYGNVKWIACIFMNVIVSAHDNIYVFTDEKWLKIFTPHADILIYKKKRTKKSVYISHLVIRVMTVFFRWIEIWYGL